MFVSSSRKLVFSQMIFFALGNTSGGMSVGSEVVEFCGSVVRALWHLNLSRAWDRNLDFGPFDLVECSLLIIKTTLPS
jgi:hypothetical protein